MMNQIFSILSSAFLVFREADGSIRWRGDYRGMKVIAVLPFDGNSNCLILLDMAASKEPTFENLICVNSDGGVAWKAELPETNDAFVSIEMTNNGLQANTWNGYRVTLDRYTGKIIQSKFVK